MREIKLTKNKVTIVDDEDYKKLSKYDWRTMKGTYTFYARTWSNGKHLLMHRFIMNAPKGMVVDHRDGNGLNNQRSNLKLTTQQENLWNWQNKRKGTSKYKGVHWDSYSGKWRAQIIHNSKKLSLGLFKDEKIAAKAYDDAVIKYRGNKGQPNGVSF